MISAPRRPKIRTYRKLAFSLLVCTVVFVLLEAGLRLADIGAPVADADQLAGFSGRSPVFVQVTSEDGRCRMRTAERKLEWFNLQEFACEKSAETKRIFCLGGSTTYGRPYDDTTSFSGWLRALIAAGDRQTSAEVINAGGISYGSRRVLTVLREVVNYQPDLVVIYCGHNEFLERTTYADLASLPTPLLKITAFLDHVHPTIDAHRLLALEILRHPAAEQILPDLTVNESTIADATEKVMQSVDTAAHGRALRNLSKVLSWAGKYDEADRLAIQAMQILPDDSDALYQGGSAWFRQGNLEQAMAAYQRAADLAPDSAQAHFGLGLVHAELSDWPSAIRHYQKASALKPSFPDIEFNLGRAFELSGDYVSAARQYQLCLELNDRFAPAYNGMGTIAARQGDMPTAVKWFRRALAADPDDPNASMNLQQAADAMAR
ncbi:MAG: tetratricopeptide repeat protein [Fuerstiella sp.]